MLRLILLLLIAVILSIKAFAQGVGINNPTPDASALLDLTSTGKGLLLPRMTTVQRNAIAAPATSLMIYNTTTTRFEYFDGLAWVPLVGGGTLDQAYDFGGAGAGRTITADAGAVLVQGNDGFQVTGTHGAGATLGLAGPGTRMFFHPRKSAFRAGRTFGTEWDDANIGDYSAAFGYSSASGSHSLASGGSSASGQGAVALGFDADASGYASIAFGYFANATSAFANAMGYIVTASGGESTAIGSYSTASGNRSITLGSNAIASGSNAKSMAYQGEAFSYGETALGIGATTYTSSTNGATQFRAANATDRLLVVGNAIDANSNGNVDLAERSDALVILKNGNTGFGSSTPQDRLHVVGNIRMVDGNQAAGRVMVSDANGTASWTNASTIAGGTLDQAYDFGGAGLGRTITADAGAVTIAGADGFVSTGTSTNSGALAPSGGGIRLVWNPNKTAFRAGNVNGNQWDPINIGEGSFALGGNTIASGGYAAAWGYTTTASNNYATAWGESNNASGEYATVWGKDNTAQGSSSSAWGLMNTATGESTTAWGRENNASQLRATAWGLNNMVDADDGTAWGNGNTVLGVRGTAWGVGNSAYAQSSTAWGMNTDATGTSSTAWGSGAQASGGNATAWGNGSQATGNDGATAFGSNTAATADQATAWGTGTSAGGAFSTAWGSGSVAQGDGATAFGTGQTSADYATAWGSASAMANSATAWGSATQASGSRSTAWGSGTDASGSEATAWGGNTTASGAYATAWGSENTASGFNSTVLGQFNTASGDRSVAAGYAHNATSFGETVLGIGSRAYTLSANGATQFRAANASDRLLSVGNAIDANNNNLVDPAERSDALVILKNGNTGLGLAAPAVRLHVAGRALFHDGFSANNAALLYRNNTDYMYIGPQSGSSVNGAALALFGTTNASAGNANGIDMNVPGNGTVRMQLLNGTFIFNTASTSGYTATMELNDGAYEIGHNSTSRFISFATGVGERVRITNVGSNLTAGGSWGVLSDRRVKSDISTIQYGLKEVMAMQPVRYFHHDTKGFELDPRGKSIEGKQDIGFIAQDLHAVVPEVVVKPADDTTSLWAVTYERLVPVLVKAIQEQQAQIDALRTELEEMKRK